MIFLLPKHSILPSATKKCTKKCTSKIDKNKAYGPPLYNLGSFIPPPMGRNGLVGTLHNGKSSLFCIKKCPQDPKI